MKTSLGDRIKEFYENRSRHYLTRRMPVVVRVDGKAFHTLTHGCEKPYDQNLINAMVGSATLVAQQIQGFKLAYTQSDEVSFLLTDYDQIKTDAWFDYNLQKITSVTAAMMTAFFNNHLRALPGNALENKTAFFDARAFNIPREEVANYFLWRAKDWERNSLQMMALANFSHKELHGKGREDLHELLHSKGINWATDCTPQQKNGTFITRTLTQTHTEPVYEQIAALVEEQTTI